MSRMMGRVRSGVYDLRLAWKILLPYAALLIVLGSVGSYAAARSAAERARQNLDQELSRLSVAADAQIRDRTLFVVESAAVGANTVGVTEAVHSGDGDRLRDLVASLVGSRLDLGLVVVTDAQGSGLVQVTRSGGQLDVRGGARWADRDFVRAALTDAAPASGVRRTGTLVAGNRSYLAAAAPLAGPDQRVVGTVIAGVEVEPIVRQLARRGGGVAAWYEPTGKLLASRGAVAPAPPAGVGRFAVRRMEHHGGRDVAELYAPLEIDGSRLATVAVGLPAREFVGGLAGDRLRFSTLLILGMGLIVVIGVVISRMIVRQLRPLVETNRALGRGDLSARAVVLGGDEFGELARGMNQMAEQLEASRSELERKVEERTEELQRLYAELVEVTEGRAEGLAAIVHDLRSHLFVISTYAELMRDPKFQPDSPRWREEYGAVIDDQARELSARVTEILDLRRAAAGKMRLDRRDEVLADIVEAAAPTLVGLAAAARLDLDFDVARNLPKVRVDRERVVQILVNLGSNAIKYTPAGGRVEISAAPGQGVVSVSIADTGVGIPEQARERIFEPFYQVRGTKTQKGQASTGLGLALVKRLVEAHEGTISFESRPGQGTTFTFTLPLAGSSRRRSAHPTAAVIDAEAP